MSTENPKNAAIESANAHLNDVDHLIPNYDGAIQLVAKLLQDARRLQEIEPKAGTEARIAEAEGVIRAVVTQRGLRRIGSPRAAYLYCVEGFFGSTPCEVEVDANSWTQAGEVAREAGYTVKFVTLIS